MGMYPEAARERDLQRYYQPWLEAQSGSLVNVNQQGADLALTYKGYKAQTSRDKALTAFAQLAALRLRVRRAMVSLIDSNQQYILAEATKTISLISDDRHKPGDYIWLGNTVIARADGVDEFVFDSTCTARDAEGNTFTAEGLVVDDLRLDDRFKDREYVVSERPGVRFYAGVPIKTKAGHRIGVYAVSDENPRDGLCVEELKFMQDVAATIMEHLEMAKDRDDRNKGERMVRGLADFIEAHDNYPLRSPSIRNASVLKRQTENARIEDIDSPESRSPPPKNSQEHHSHQNNHARVSSTESEDDSSRVFYRAANIIRASTGADGVVFFGTVQGNVAGATAEPPITGAEPSDDSQTSDSGPPSGDARLVRRQKRSSPSVSMTSREGVNVSDTDASARNSNKLCEVIGLSAGDSSARDGPITEKTFSFSERSMDRYIRRFPYGKFFSFTHEGAGISSDERSETEQHSSAIRALTNSDLPKKTKKNGEQLIPTELLKDLPGIRSLIFLPLWDPTVEKWIAGAFIWTATAGRLMSPDNELPYLKAFGNSIISEVARMNAQKADRAKTTFIASISHELRSPLHGILGIVEFLHDTANTSYQSSLFTSIEICGKTLLDTIDHVLDYAKINKLGRMNKRKKNGSQQKINFADNSVMGVTAEFDLSSLVEEVVEAVCAGHAFKKAHTGAFNDDSKHQPRMAQDAFTKEQASLPSQSPEQVAILLNVNPASGWNVRTQPGALRRIVMNLLGNALKYTASGHVGVTLKAQRGADPSRLDVHLHFRDTGIGMSMEYQRTRLFSPFSQEDPFAVGTGLGLSIVRQIIDSLGGFIDIKSTKNVGTDVDVFLSLPVICKAKNPEVSILPRMVSTKGLRACLLKPNPAVEQNEKAKINQLMSSFSETCVNWFEMEVFEASSLEGVEADMFFVTDPNMTEKLFNFHASKSGTPPLIIVCRNPTEEIGLKAREEHRIAALGRHVEVVSQPCGPRKLARVIQDCLRGAREYAEKPVISRAITSPSCLPEHSSNPVADDVNSIAPVRGAPQRSLSGSEASSGLEVPERSLLRDALKAAARSTTNNGSAAAGPPSQSLNLHPAIVDEEKDAPLRILVVDDNPINLQLLVMFMKKYKYNWAEATNGLAALERYKDSVVSFSTSATTPDYTTTTTKKSFDYVLMDISMPIMDGLASTREIRQFEQQKGLKAAKIVALTGLASAQAQEEAMGSGIDHYLPKPVKFAELKKLLERR
ncbi:hypothetical protein K490DRAFT_36772 [Saccharata proteae CBS 121410]|uniref:Uncharacterized protein n=1 Tax=Saccharata proteae CBS 121410 TaxID=1314787 RepID=A0A6A5YEZ7_9PEZI|nr:hypothetical protein K490DRAFT_36772 [Saccharata proteae CBS 121410]